MLAKPHHVIAPGSFRNSQEEPYGSNDMAHNHYLEEARKKIQERNRNSKPSVMHTTSLQNTTNGSKLNPRSNNQISRSLPVSKSSCGMSNDVSLYNKILRRGDSSAKDTIPKTRNNTKPFEQRVIHRNPSRQIASIGQRFSPKKSSAVHEKLNTPRSCLRWKPTGRIFKIVGLRWIPTRKMFTDNTTKVDSEPPNGSNDDITNPYECDQLLNVQCRVLLNLSAVGINPLVHSFRALSTLRRSGLRTASAAVKPCQGDSSEFYLITGRIPMVASAGQRHVNSQPHAHTLDF
ncbi:hypothetical protein Tco_1032351 [Tanacetum coccineum]|uniref:Uncharacterized protein n=1 Tax=Tanacetum coccineum TaxID=301880 RepID=A0ABQ5GD24_9ASTR